MMTIPSGYIGKIYKNKKKKSHTTSIALWARRGKLLSSMEIV